ESGDYPLARDGFMLGPHLPAALVAPHAGAVSGAGSTAARTVPVGLTRPVGPRVGTSPNGDRVFLSGPDCALGLAVVAAPGSGKSELLRNVMGHHMMGRTAADQAGSSPGASNA